MDIVGPSTCYLVCETRSHAKLYLGWSVIHYHVTFELHSGCGLVRVIEKGGKTENDNDRVAFHEVVSIYLRYASI